jgi:2'-hydroxyisoflavone reductase
VRLLLLGGTVFLGRHLVEATLERGHTITLFNRGLTNAGVFPDVEHLQGDRDGDLSAIAGRSFDAVIDTSGYLPRHVSAAARMLADAVEHYTFVSSISVYRDPLPSGFDESLPVAELSIPGSEDVGPDYGALKALCEKAAGEAMPGRVAIVRAGVIVGPHDPTDRFSYWVGRIAHGGDVLAPRPADQPVQLIDARDLASWMLDLAEGRRPGVFNAVGPAEPMTMERMVATMRATLNPEARIVWVDESFLAAAGVEPWTELPFWLAPNTVPDNAHFLSADTSRAMAAGLRFRPLTQTVADTHRSLAEPPTLGPAGDARGAAMAANRERELLDQWRPFRDAEPPSAS